MGKIISIANNKGGVGKTTTTLNLATALTKLNKKVLMLDLDPQASLSVNYGLEPLETHNSIYNVFMDELEINEIICKLEENLYLVPATIELSKVELNLISRLSRETILKKKLNTIVNNFDYILIDNSPSLGLLTINSLVASDYVIAPMDPTYLSLRGLEILNEVVDQVKEINENLQFMGVIITMVDTRVNHHREIIEELKNKYPIFNSVIKRSIKFSDSGLNMSSVFEYAGDKFSGSIAYLDIAKEVINNG